MFHSFAVRCNIFGCFVAVLAFACSMTYLQFTWLLHIYVRNKERDVYIPIVPYMTFTTPPQKQKKSATHLPMIEQKRSTDRLSSPVSFSLEVCYFCYFFENIPRCVLFLFAKESFTRSFFGIQKLFCTIQSISRWMCLVVFWVSFTRLYW